VSEPNGTIALMPNGAAFDPGALVAVEPDFNGMRAELDGQHVSLHDPPHARACTNEVGSAFSSLSMALRAPARGLAPSSEGVTSSVRTYRRAVRQVSSGDRRGMT